MMYGSWIYNYLYTQCLSSLTLYVRTSTNKTDRHDITEILLKVPLNTITLAPTITRIFILPCLIMSKVRATYNELVNRKMKLNFGLSMNHICLFIVICK